MILLLLLLRVLCEELRFVPLLKKNMALKSSRQIEKPYHMAMEYFGPGTPNFLFENWHYDVFLYMNGDDPVAFSRVAVERGYRNERRLRIFGSRRVEVPYLCFYTVIVAEKYRGRGICGKLFADIVECLRKEMYMPETTILALHLSPVDPMMYVAAGVYYKLGFRNGVFSDVTPEHYAKDVDSLMEKSRDLYELAADPSLSGTRGRVMVLYCELKNFGIVKEPPADWLEKGKTMMDILRRMEKETTVL